MKHWKPGHNNHPDEVDPDKVDLKPGHNNPDKVDAMGSGIDLCECSRRVQGHLAILYPELH